MIRLSLIIPTHNRSERLIAALESVIRQDLPAADWECVVVSNNSTDDTVARFGDFAARYPGLNLRLVTEDGPGVSYARNRGIAETSAPLLVFIDDDERINPGFLRAYADFFDAHPDAVVAGGRIIAEYVTGRPVSCRPGAGRRQHGVPAFGGPALRGLRPFAGACRTDVDRG